jgi:hypothetical protein
MKTLKSRVIKKHSRNCYMRGKSNPWSGVIDGTFWGNFAANPNSRGASYLWVKVTCNDPRCSALKAVHTQVLVDAD